jgi:hypothetical protein
LRCGARRGWAWSLGERWGCKLCVVCCVVLCCVFALFYLMYQMWRGKGEVYVGISEEIGVVASMAASLVEWFLGLNSCAGLLDCLLG